MRVFWTGLSVSVCDAAVEHRHDLSSTALTLGSVVLSKRSLLLHERITLNVMWR